MTRALEPGSGDMDSYEELAEALINQPLRKLKPSKTNQEVFEEWWRLRTDENTPKPLAPKSQRGYRGQMNAFLKWLDSQGLHVYFVTPEHVNDYIGHLKKRGLGARSREIYLHAPSSFYGYLKDIKGLVRANPVRAAVRHFGLESWPTTPLRALKVAEVSELLQAAGSLRDFTAVLILFKTGIRANEYLNLSEKHILWDEKRLDVAIHPPKRHVNRVLLDDEALAILRLWIERKQDLHPGDTRLFPVKNLGGKTQKGQTTAFEKAWRKVARRSGLVTPDTPKEERITAHTGRRTFTTLFKEAGVPAHVVAELRGDKRQSHGGLISEPTQEIYNNITWETLRRHYDAAMPEFGAVEIYFGLKRRADTLLGLDSIQELGGASGF